MFGMFRKGINSLISSKKRGLVLCLPIARMGKGGGAREGKHNCGICYLGTDEVRKSLRRRKCVTMSPKLTLGARYAY